MPTLDTVVLFAVANKDDKYHRAASVHMKKISTNEDYWIGGFALFEFDVVLKSRGLSYDKRMEIHALTIKDFPGIVERTLKIGSSTLYLTAKIEKEYGLEYFDAGIASESLQMDGIVVSTDRIFDEVPNVRRIW